MDAGGRDWGSAGSWCGASFPHSTRRACQSKDLGNGGVARRERGGLVGVARV